MNGNSTATQLITEVQRLFKREFSNHLTDQGFKKTKIIFKDKLNDDVYWTKEVTRGFLAKMYHEKRVIGAVNYIPVVEV